MSRGRFVACTALLGTAIVAGASTADQARDLWPGVLHEHPRIQYAARPTTDRVAKLSLALARGERSLTLDPRTGYLRSALDALDIPIASQLLVFSKTGVQRDYTSPRTPRALYFDASVAVGYVPGAPMIEIAAHDPQQGVVFYVLDQTADAPSLTRRTSCLGCHVSAGTLEIPGLLARSHVVDDHGDVLPQQATLDVSHQTPHTDRWGGWFVTSNGAPPPYSQRAHEGNITFSAGGVTSNQVFVDWNGSSPETRGYLSASSDITALLLFDHQVRAINLLTRVNWEWRVAFDRDAATIPSGPLLDFVNELADYLLFVGEVPPSAPLTPSPALAAYLAARAPADRLGRSCGQIDLVNRLLRYPCSYMVYAEAFDALPPIVKQTVYRRMIDTLSTQDPHARSSRPSADDRRVVLEILRATKADFPRA